MPKIWGDRRTKEGRIEANQLALVKFIFKYLIWWPIKIVFHVCTLGRFRKKT
jgi:hypothetical protein